MTRARPLAIQLEPFEDECWNGYLARVAASHRMEVGQLCRLLMLGPHGTVRDHGIAMLPETLNELAHVLGPAPVRLHGMLLQRFATAFTAPGADLVRGFDPSPLGGPLPKSARAVLAWLRTRPGTVACPVCRREDPSRWVLSWRLPWHVACELHQRVLTRVDGSSPPRRTAGVDERLLSAQRRMLAAAYETPPRAETVSFIAQVHAVLELLCGRESGARSSWVTAGPPLALVVRHLPVAVGVVDGGGDEAVRDCRDSLFSAASAQRRALTVFARHVVPARSGVRAQLEPYRLAGTPSAAAVGTPPLRRRLSPGGLPQQLPMTVYVGDLSDLLYPLPIEQGRVVAAVLAEVTAGGSIGMALKALDLPAELFDSIHAQWARLRAHGREEDLLAAAATAAGVVDEAGVNYTRRRWLARRYGTTLAGEIVRSLDGLINAQQARGWLRHVWAGNAKPGPGGLSQLADLRGTESFEHIDTEHLDALAAALDAAIMRARPRTRFGDVVVAA